MPPLLTESEHESDSEGLDSIPPKPQPKSAKAPAKNVEEEEEEEDPEQVVEETQEANGAGADDDDDDGDEEDGEEFAVEKILKHDYAESGVILYQVKWAGYDDPSDMTWEPRSNLEGGAKEVLKAYHKKIGGTPEPQIKKGGKAGRGTKRKSESVADSPAPKGKKGRKSDANGDNKWKPPLGSWENEIDVINTISEGTPKTPARDAFDLFVYVTFNDGNKASFSLDTVRQKCPQKLIDYFTQHLTFK